MPKRDKKERRGRRVGKRKGGTGTWTWCTVSLSLSLSFCRRALRVCSQRSIGWFLFFFQLPDAYKYFSVSKICPTGIANVTYVSMDAKLNLEGIQHSYYFFNGRKGKWSLKKSRFRTRNTIAIQLTHAICQEKMITQDVIFCRWKVEIRLLNFHPIFDLTPALSLLLKKYLQGCGNWPLDLCFCCQIQLLPLLTPISAFFFKFLKILLTNLRAGFFFSRRAGLNGLFSFYFNQTREAQSERAQTH